MLVGLGHLYYEFLCRSAPVSGATFPRATAPLSRASLGGKVYTQPPPPPGEHGLAVKAPVVPLSSLFQPVRQNAEERPLQRGARAVSVGGRA